MLTISDVIYNAPDKDGMVTGNIFFPNGYSLSLLTHANMNGYDVTFCKQSAKNPDVWIAQLDSKLLTISTKNNLTEQTEEQVNNYINFIKNLTL
jgi:hypothetical protein